MSLSLPVATKIGTKWRGPATCSNIGQSGQGISTSALNVPGRHDQPSNHTPHQLQLPRLSSLLASTIKSPSCVAKAHSLGTLALTWDMLLPSAHHQPPDLSYIPLLAVEPTDPFTFTRAMFRCCSSGGHITQRSPTPYPPGPPPLPP